MMDLQAALEKAGLRGKIEPDALRTYAQIFGMTRKVPHEGRIVTCPPSPAEERAAQALAFAADVIEALGAVPA
jgi:hypothetical protein